MWLLLDIGNSSTKAAIFDRKRVRRRARMEEIFPSSESALSNWTSEARIRRAGAVSVVPDANGRWTSIVRRLYGVDLEFYDADSRLPFELTYETPYTLGNDRIAAAAAAWIRHGRPAGRPVVAVDAGTAITYDVVTAAGVFPGGPIAPGPELLRRAIRSGTAQLPEVDLKLPDSVIGRSTESAIRSGLMNGFLDSVSGMLRRLETELGEEPIIVMTGGWANWLNGRLEARIRLEHDLVVLGVSDLMGLATT